MPKITNLGPKRDTINSNSNQVASTETKKRFFVCLLKPMSIFIDLVSLFKTWSLFQDLVTLMIWSLFLREKKAQSPRIMPKSGNSNQMLGKENKAYVAIGNK